MRFIWDPRKAASNLRKHSVTFEEAKTAFDDEHALVQPDLVHGDRLLILGMSARARMLFVVYIEREPDDTIRIISARRATPHERKAYANE
ncbi:MAG: BrnT family toxin [Polyangiaceae bacterium]